MKVILSSLAVCLLLGVSSVSAQLTCFSCTATFLHPTAADAADACYSPTAGTGNLGCASTEYCLTTIVLRDGLISSIARSCQDPTSDQDASIDTIPGSDCQTTITTGGSVVDETTCYHPCDTDECNTATDSSYTPCPNACANGYCNYFSGTCVCPATFTGADCSTAVAAATLTYRLCAQCNSEVDGAACTDGTIAGTPCLLDDTMEAFCAYSTTNVLLNGVSVAQTVTRGCALAAAFTHRDQCFFSAPADPSLPDANYLDYTCSAVCDTDGCNMAAMANGLVAAPETQGLYCVQCSDTTGAGTCNMASTRSLCPSASTHCVSTVSYYFSARNDLSHSVEAAPAIGYRLLSVVRECATAAVTTGCTASTVASTASSLQMYTCQESCTIDGCNTGWPSRPSCVQCFTDISTDVLDGYDRCLSNPPAEIACTYPYEGYCVITDRHKAVNRAASERGFTRFVQRGCTRVDIGSACVTENVSPLQQTQNCNYTCSTDGCNQGIFGVFNGSTVNSVSICSLLFGLLFQLLFRSQ